MSHLVFISCRYPLAQQMTPVLTSNPIIDSKFKKKSQLFFKISFLHLFVYYSELLVHTKMSEKQEIAIGKC